MNGEQWSQLYFDNCRVPKENLLLGPGGFKKQISGFNVERLGNASRALALGRYAFNMAKEHATVGKQFGRVLCEFQGRPEERSGGQEGVSTFRSGWTTNQ